LLTLRCVSRIRYHPHEQRESRARHDRRNNTLHKFAKVKITESWPQPVETKMKKTTYMLGLASGVVLALNWKLLVKEGIKAGVKVGREVKRVSAETLEDLEDAKAEAMHDLAQEQKAARENAKQDTGNRKPDASAS
jgi:hypothetical protein